MSTLPDPRTSADGQISGRIQHGPRPHSPAFMTGPRCWCVSFFFGSGFLLSLGSSRRRLGSVFLLRMVIVQRSFALRRIFCYYTPWEPGNGAAGAIWSFFLMESCICVRVRVYAAHLRLYFLYPVFVFRFRFPSLGGCYSILLLVFDCCNPCCPCARACPGEPPITPPFRSPRDTLTAQSPLYCIISQ